MQQDKQIFLQAIKNLGLKPVDLEPVGIYDLQLQSRDITSNMTKNEKQFYLFKKSQALEEYRYKLLKNVQAQIQRLKKYSYNNRKVNPMIANLLKQHEKLCNSKIQKINRMKRQREKSEKSNSKNSLLDFGKTSPICISRKSSYSANSRNSRRSQTSKSSVKQRLERVRQREIQTASYKKLVLQKKLQENSKKALRAQQHNLNKSRNVKTRSDISRTIVLQNKQKKKQQDKLQTLSTFQKINEKKERAQLIMDLKRSSVKKKMDFPYKLMRNSMEQQYRDIIKQQHNRKMALAAFRKQQQNLKQRYTIDIHKYQREQKKKHLRDYISFRKDQQKIVNLSIVNKQNTQLARAQQRRQQKQNKEKMKYLQQRIKQQINMKNKSIIDQRKSIQTENKNRKKHEKQEQIQDILRLKRYLKKDLKLIDSSQSNRYRQSFSMSINRRY